MKKISGARFLAIILLSCFLMPGASNAALYLFDGSAGAILSDGDDVTFASGETFLSADCVFELAEDDAVATVQIGENVASGDVVIRGTSDTVLVFDVTSPTSIINVNVLNDLIFASNEDGEGSCHTYVAVRGKGQVRFRMPSGRTIYFACDAADGDYGAHLRILMEQDRDEMDDHSQVAFEKWSYYPDDVNTNITAHSFVIIGRNSSISFISPLASGLPDEAGAIDYGYGSLSFDPSNIGPGRLILQIEGDTPGLGFDGSLNIYGNYIAGSGIDVTDVLTADLRGDVVSKYRAGICAKMRVAHRVVQEYYADDADGWEEFCTDASERRGLVVFNYNRTFPLLANNYDQTTAIADPETFGDIIGLTDSQWFVANTRQPGFVLGNNGMIEVDNNMFLDFFACGINDASLFPVDGVHVATGATGDGGTHDATWVKIHNPSALIVDGYAYRKTGTTAAADPEFLYDSDDVAQIMLRGNAGMFVRVAADSATGEVSAVTIDGDGTTFDSLNGWYIAGTIGDGVYDGNYIPVYNEDGDIVSHTNIGEIAMDIEGPLKVKSTATFDDVVQASGWVNVPSVLIDFSGTELALVDDVLVQVDSRPLATGDAATYYRYNTSNILVNDWVEFDHVTLIHNDVSRDASDLPSSYGYPAIIGGELPALRIAKQLTDDPAAIITTYSGSPIFLQNSVIACHESLVSAGVHWVVRDGLIDLNRDGVMDEGDVLSSGDNLSQIIFYNRGNAYDVSSTGIVRGRCFVLGSRFNLMADDFTADPLSVDGEYYPVSSLRDAFVDVYRQRQIPHELNPDNDQANTIRLEVATRQEDGVEDYEKGIHSFYLADRSTVNLGWYAGQFLKEETVDGEPTMVPHLEVDNRYWPWEFSPSILATVRADDPENELGHRFSPYLEGVGELRFTGDNIYLGSGGRYNEYGMLEPEENELSPINLEFGCGVVFSDFGGKISVGDANDIMLNTIIARRSSVIVAGAGIVDVPSDQVIMQPYGKVELYGFDVEVDPNPMLVENSQSLVMSIDASMIPMPEDFTPVKSLFHKTRGPIHSRGFVYRATDSVTAPVAMPTSGLVVLGAGDVVDQVRVSGATRAKPFHLWLTGDTTGFCRVREFVSVASDPAVLGEGPIAALFLDHGARIGLGSRSYDAHSVNAWNQLGLDKVTLYLNGNCVVDLNSDLIISDKLPLVATENFGMGDDAHRITFYSEVPREIRVLAGGELDLSSFGRSNAVSQQIAFGGKVKLVIEPGAKIRFPSTVTSDNPANGPILYFNDDSELVFLGNDNPDRGRWADALTGSDLERSKIMGMGQIWLNKRARCIIMENALVGVESDAHTPITDLTISIQRDASMYLGDRTRSGGAFQVGNVVDGGGDGTNARTIEGFIPTYINFALKLNGENAAFHVDREGFLGFAAGVVNKDGNPNGDIPSEATDPETDENQFYAWRVQTLRNVKNIAIQVTRGFFDHNQIYDGSASASYGSVMALGPIDYNDDIPLSAVNGGQYTLLLGKATEAFLRGGGNVLFVDAGIPHTDPLAVSIWSTSAYLADSGNSGKYTVAAPGVMIRTYVNPIGSETITRNYTVDSYSFASRAVTNSTSQGGALIEWYSIFGMPIYAGGYIPAGKGQSTEILATYLVLPNGSNDAIIRRVIAPPAKDKYGNPVKPALALDKGYFVGTIPNANGDPETLGVPV